MATRPLCSVDGCGKPWRTLGMCAVHYNRHWRGADVDVQIVHRGGPSAWIADHINHSGDECLPWPFQRNNMGYATVSVAGKKRSAARVMCEARHGPPPSPSHDTAHSCGKGHEGCMNAAHLSWKTRVGNMQDAIDHGTTTRGEKNTQAVLTKNDVIEIRAMGTIAPYKVVAKAFNISTSAVGLIVRRERWGWLK